MYNRSDGGFSAKCPVILAIDGKQLEVCSCKDSEMAVKWNAIDLKEELDWYGSRELNLAWGKNAVSSAVIGKRIRKIEIIQIKYETYNSADKLLNFILWLNGIGLNIGDRYLAIYNAVDETQFSDIRNDACIYTKI